MKIKITVDSASDLTQELIEKYTQELRPDGKTQVSVEYDENNNLIEKITYNDGTSLEIKGSSSCGVRNGMFIDDFIDTKMLGEVIRTKDVKSITISGIEIPLN